MFLIFFFFSWTATRGGIGVELNNDSLEVLLISYKGEFLIKLYLPLHPAHENIVNEHRTLHKLLPKLSDKIVIW